MESKGLNAEAKKIHLLGSRIDYRSVCIDSYLASVIADFLRQRLLDQHLSFTFETVMSHVSKVDFMKDAQARGYRVYLYFVSTENPELNADRVAIRVRQGGHPVPAAKVHERYYKSLQLLPKAIATSHRAYIFDNSADRAQLLAEITDGIRLEFRTDEIPDWFFEGYADAAAT